MPDLAQPDLPDHWTGGIDELVAAANALLPALLPPERSTRQKDEINARLVRHYTTTGHLPPAGRSGRDAHYSRRHLLALLALRRLMAEGIGGAMLHGLLAGQGEEALEGAALHGLAGLAEVSRPAFLALPDFLTGGADPSRVEVEASVSRQRAVSFLQGLRTADAPTDALDALAAPAPRPSKKREKGAVVEDLCRIRFRPGLEVMVGPAVRWPESDADWADWMQALEVSLREVSLREVSLRDVSLRDRAKP